MTSSLLLTLLMPPAQAKPIAQHPIPLPPPASSAPEPPARSFPIIQNALPGQPPGQPSITSAGSVLPVPALPIPQGRYPNQENNTFGRFNPPPTPALMAGPRFRVVVTQALAPEQREQIRQLVPDAFRSNFRGKPVMQVGIFQAKEKVEEMTQLLESHGFNTIVEALP